MTRLNLDGWIPVALFVHDGELMVDWCDLGERPFAEPFFEETIQRLFRHPYPLLFRQTTSITAIEEWQALRPGLQPTGFIFHMSRCGSTLVSHMLAALPDSIIVSEAAPIDALVRLPSVLCCSSEERRASWLRALVSALGQRRRGNESRYFIKFDCWHTLDLPIIRRAFPDVPWVFVYRDPVEVLVSLTTRPAAWTVPGMISPERLGVDFLSLTRMPREEICARILARMCDAAVLSLKEGGRAVNYRELPHALWSSLPAHFRVSWRNTDVSRMQEAARYDVKSPSAVFADDRLTKQQRATDSVRDAAAVWLTDVYRQLETLSEAALQADARDDRGNEVVHSLHHRPLSSAVSSAIR